MIHDKVDIDHWKAMFPLDRLRAEARAKIHEERTHNPAAWIEKVIHREASYWWFENRPGVLMFDPAESIAGVQAERARDPEEWDRFHIERDVALASPKSHDVTSPYHLAVLEQLRTEMVAAIPVGQAIPADVFLWIKGESPRRDVTKVGGLPYWPSARPWPQTPDGNPLQFVCQFCFADSRDIIGDLPSDILAIFIDPHHDLVWSDDGSQRGWQFHWLALGESDLLSAEKLPEIESAWPISPYYGAIHRTHDYPDLGEDGGWFGWDHLEWSGLGLIQATMIGGAPWWQQGNPDLPGRFLCVHESIKPALHVPYPYLNVPDPIGPTFQEQYPEDDLTWGDAGRLYLNVDGNRIHWEIQCG
jgi:hypothetical protein